MPPAAADSSAVLPVGPWLSLVVWAPVVSGCIGRCVTVPGGAAFETASAEVHPPVPTSTPRPGPDRAANLVSPPLLFRVAALDFKRTFRHWHSKVASLAAWVGVRDKAARGVRTGPEGEVEDEQRSGQAEGEAASQRRPALAGKRRAWPPPFNLKLPVAAGSGAALAGRPWQAQAGMGSHCGRRGGTLAGCFCQWDCRC